MSGEPSIFDNWAVLDPELERRQINDAFSGLAGRLLGKLRRADLNRVGDQPIAISASTFVVTDVVVTNASATPSGNENGNICSAPGGGGFAVLNNVLPSPPITAIAALDHLTSPDLWLSLRRTFVVPSSVITSSNLYLNITEPDGAPCTVDIFVFGLAWPPD